MKKIYWIWQLKVAFSTWDGGVTALIIVDWGRDCYMSNIDNVLFWGEEKSEEVGARRERHRGEKKKKSIVICEYHDAKDKQV